MQPSLGEEEGPGEVVGASLPSSETGALGIGPQQSQEVTAL